MEHHTIIVGAGIAGLCTAVALRRAGHDVVVYEKSQFSNEVGAALMVTPNGARILSRLGFSFENARAVKIDNWNVVRGNDQELIASIDSSGFDTTFGNSIWSIHRADLHNELRRLAESPSEPGTPVRINLASEVIGASEDGEVSLKSGLKVSADLVVAADGLHSILRGVVMGEDVQGATSTGLSAFRFLLDTESSHGTNDSLAFLKQKGSVATLFADSSESARERHIMTYPCRNGRTFNFVGVHPTRPQDSLGDQGSADDQAIKASMLQEFQHFCPEILKVIGEAEHGKIWPLHAHQPLSNWCKGRIVLVGDAAHPMLPFGGQGSNSAMEDAGCLGYMFDKERGACSTLERLAMFEDARRQRAARVQILSSVRAGRESEVVDALRVWADPLGSDVPTTMMGRIKHDYGHDMYEKSRLVVAKATRKEIDGLCEGSA